MTGDPYGFDADALFGEDFLYFHETWLTPEVDDAEAALIAGLLEVRRGTAVLDVGCGTGRIARRLAQRGARVTGIDRNRDYLERARRDAEAAGVALELIHGDMHELDAESTFDAALIWFTTFGYDDDTASRALLRRLHHALRPGGRLLIESLNRDQVLFDRQVWSVLERGDDFLLDRTDYDVHSGRLFGERITIRGGRVRRTPYSLRLWTPPELCGWLRDAGFAEVEIVDEDGERLRLDSARMVAVAMR